MPTPTTRLLTLLELLQARERLSSGELAERLEVDQRSVRRYVAMLQELGIPIEGERGRYGGYRLRRGFRLPPLMFTEEEALAVTLGLLSASRMGLAAAAPAVEGALAKVDRVLPETVREQVRAVQESLHLDLGPSPPAPVTTNSIVLTLSRAVRERRRVHFDYKSSQGHASERDFDAYGMVFRTGRWYAVGWCHLAQAMRSFRLDRMGEVELTDVSFSPPAAFNAHSHLIRSLSEMYEPWTMEVLMDTTLAEAQRWIPPIVGTLAATAGGVMLTSRANSLEWMAYVLARIPWPVKAWGPIELAEALRELSGRLGNLASTLEPCPAGFDH
jgi:predicted DNA-binding transcriptional regulator YafY